MDMDSQLSRLTTQITFATLAMTLVASIAAAQTPTPTPAPALPTPAPAKPSAPLPAGARIAFINLEQVFAESDLGKAGQAKWRGLTEKLFANLSAKDKEIQTMSEKIKAQQATATPSLLTAWNMELARLQREAQYAQQEARAQAEQLQAEVLAEFGKKVQPVIDALRTEKGLHAILSVQSGVAGLSIISSDAGLDLSSELIKKLNAIK